jgi:hypothetical protein
VKGRERERRGEKERGRDIEKGESEKEERKEIARRERGPKYLCQSAALWGLNSTSDSLAMWGGRLREEKR